MLPVGRLLEFTTLATADDVNAFAHTGDCASVMCKDEKLVFIHVV